MKPFVRYLTLAIVVIGSTANWARAGILKEDYQARTILGFTTSGVYDPKETYKIGAVDWTATLKPLHPVELAKGGTANFLNVLKGAYTLNNGWKFETAANDLSANSLLVHSYDVLGTAGDVGIQQPNKVGFDVEYKPSTAQGSTDPTTNLHWIQVITDNHNITTKPGHGNAENVVDVPTGQANPYYDTKGAADGKNFLDAPDRPDGGKSHTWIADLFLVSGPLAAGTKDNPSIVTIYNGIEWGWTNQPAAAPEPSSFALLGLGGLGLAVGAYRRRNAVI